MTVTSAIRRPRVIHGEGPREDPSPYSICAAIADALSPLRLAAVGTVRNSVRWAMMMKRRESSHGYRERTSGPAPG
ncbi:hypothetical protein CN092_35930, partial [Sinorhizobium meliloti]